ncbi:MULTISPECIES: hypothetical protein [unclassified Pseudoalteromonas]|uniref:hypothetical protein n=1 Tax=unclassified Pseudoalteromonas TaxID=194690 RepID=UPI0020980252|nr:hypothetical protein [Pseudoalteromonas sp. XMcav2-N]MCO7190788.1 hypothetical protein [Pseudoalteromonas sp. XMcav2-N]
MNTQQLSRTRNVFLAGVLLLQAAQLIWEHFNGGIVTHHLLMRADLPGVSNWWGLIILPALVWITGIHIQARLTASAQHDMADNKAWRTIQLGFGMLLLFSLCQTIVFSLGFHTLAKFMLLGLLITALFVPLYRMECILGYVLGACLMSGPAMPFVGVVLFATVSALSHFAIKPVIARVITKKHITS